MTARASDWLARHQARLLIQRGRRNPEHRRATLRRLTDRGTPARVSFDDPDFVIDIETLNDEAAISGWTRDDLSNHPFVRVE
jgi:hypothetical protein